MIPSALFTDYFSIKKTVQSVSSVGKVTNKLKTLSNGNKGRFSSVTGSRNRDFLGSVKQYSMILYCDVNCNIEFGHIIEDESACIQYDVVRVDKKKYYGTNHHMQVLLEERRIEIS